jgi:hypothetical protein
MLVRFEYGQHDDFYVRVLGADEANALDASRPGHIDVHQDDIRLVCFKFIEDVAAIDKSAQAMVLGGLVDQLDQGVPEIGVVFIYKDIDRHFKV